MHQVLEWGVHSRFRYIISTFYEKTFYANTFETTARLMVKGLKLLVLFTALNIG